jgi:hypothetical protein
VVAKFDVSRRAFVASAAALPLAFAADDWVELFDGRTMEGWTPSEHKESWKVSEGALVADGGRSHLFYNGPVHGANFKNFELEVDCLARPNCNSGVYFHTAYQETNFPFKGFEVQINNTFLGDGSYRERKKTGSLYGLRNIYKQFIPDDQWFKIRLAVRGKNVQIRLNDLLVVDYRTHAAGDSGRPGDRAFSGPRHVCAAMPQQRIGGALPQCEGAAAARRYAHAWWRGAGGR